MFAMIINLIEYMQRQGRPLGHSYEVNLVHDRIAALRARGPACWDVDFYLAMYPDIRQHISSATEAWEHYVMLGQFEDRLDR